MLKLNHFVLSKLFFFFLAILCMGFGCPGIARLHAYPWIESNEVENRCSSTMHEPVLDLDYIIARIMPVDFCDSEACVDFLEATLNDFLKMSLGDVVFNISGYQQHALQTGTYGSGEHHPKLRISLINGILNCPESHSSTLELFSCAHAHNNIHYVFRACEGWTRDIVRCVLCKAGVVSEVAEILAQTWRRLIQEMGGVDGGGTIIHYAHSIGGSETYLAKQLLTVEEQRMIRVVTFGSATLIPDEGFRSVVNYASRRDGVSLLDVVNFIRGLVDPCEHIVYVDTFLGIPLVDHTLDSPSYKNLIEELGQKHMTEFLSL